MKESLESLPSGLQKERLEEGIVLISSRLADMHDDLIKLKSEMIDLEEKLTELQLLSESLFIQL